ncbi:Tetrapyrrole methylase family protein/MazG family protein OS=Ureibacillus acetophenoni OX=614649 GN=SAMN05877842_12333 PE=4 SV=1 [Ureibacillus acetophenoni]
MRVFGEVSLIADSNDVVTNWEAIKKQEKGQQDDDSILKGEFRASSSLQTSFDYQKKALQLVLIGQMQKIRGKSLRKSGKSLARKLKMGQELRLDEFGDVLFTLVNIARFYKISPEEAMIHANEKFCRRFQYIEKKVKESGKSFGDFTLEQLDQFWNEAKMMEKGRS